MKTIKRILAVLLLVGILSYFSPFPIRYSAPVAGAPVLGWGGAVCERRIVQAMGGFWLPHRVQYCVYRFSEPVEGPEEDGSWAKVSPDWGWNRSRNQNGRRQDMIKVFGLDPGTKLEKVEMASPERISLMGDGLFDAERKILYVRFFEYG